MLKRSTTCHRFQDDQVSSGREQKGIQSDTIRDELHQASALCGGARLMSASTVVTDLGTGRPVSVAVG